jgi:hypothetical protein
VREDVPGSENVDTNASVVYLYSIIDLPTSDLESDLPTITVLPDDAAYVKSSS